MNTPKTLKEAKTQGNVIMEAVDHSIDDLDEEIIGIMKKIAEVESDPKSKNPDTGSICRWSKPAQKKLLKLRSDVAQLTTEKRALQGNPVPCCGYSGRQSNRRR